MTATIGGAPAEVALLSPAIGTANIGDHFIEMAVRRLLPPQTVFARFSIRRELTADEIAAINRTRCALICGTNLYQHEWESALDAATLDRIRVPVIPVGVGGSSASLSDVAVSRRTADMIRAIHSKCERGSVRDPYSHDVVTAVGVENITLTGCPVFQWSRNVSLPPVQPLKRSRIVVTARNWLMHRWPDNVDHPVQIRLLKRLWSSFPLEQMTFAIHEELDERLVREIGIPESNVLRSDDPEDYVALYTDPATVVVAMRLHAGMLAVANGVPAVFVGHDTRTYSFCDMAGLDYVELFSERAADDCVERVQNVLDGAVESFDAASASHAELGEAMQDFLRVNDIPHVRPNSGKAGDAMLQSR